MPAIFCTNVDHSDEDVMVFSQTATADQFAAFLTGKLSFDDCYEVPADEIQFYLFDPVWLSPAQESRVLAA